MNDWTQLLRDLEIRRAQNCYKSILFNDVTHSADSRAGLRTDRQTGYEVQNERGQSACVEKKELVLVFVHFLDLQKFLGNDEDNLATELQLRKQNIWESQSLI